VKREAATQTLMWSGAEFIRNQEMEFLMT